MKGYNLRSEPFYNRLKRNPVVSEVFSSQPEHLGDPLTPVFVKNRKDPVIMKLFMPGDKPRATSFSLHNNLSFQESQYLQSRIKGTFTAITVGHTQEMILLDYNAFVKEQPGDYMYQSTNITWDLEEGMWGFMRVTEDSQKVIEL